MERQSIRKMIRQDYGEMVNLKEAANILGKRDRRAAAAFLADVPSYRIGREIKYFASDIARAIDQCQMRSDRTV